MMYHITQGSCKILYKQGTVIVSVQPNPMAFNRTNSPVNVHRIAALLTKGFLITLLSLFLWLSNSPPVPSKNRERVKKALYSVGLAKRRIHPQELIPFKWDQLGYWVWGRGEGCLPWTAIDHSLGLLRLSVPEQCLDFLSQVPKMSKVCPAFK